jgi:hypothetical protein
LPGPVLSKFGAPPFLGYPTHVLHVFGYDSRFDIRVVRSSTGNLPIVLTISTIGKKIDWALRVYVTILEELYIIEILGNCP